LQWNIICVGGLVTGAATHLTGAEPTWTIGAAVTIGADSEVLGSLTSVGAITLGAGATWTGALTSSNGAVDLGVLCVIQVINGAVKATYYLFLKLRMRI
jgi:serine acetyltransferase